jgi:hypothetical protein
MARRNAAGVRLITRKGNDTQDDVAARSVMVSGSQGQKRRA